MSTVFLGIPVVISPWTLLLVALFWLDGALYIKKMYREANRSSLIVPGLISGIIVLVSTALHELAHGLVAEALGVHIVSAGLTGWGGYVVCFW